MCSQRYQARFESCTKVWVFHYWETADTSTPAVPAALARTHSTASSSKRGVFHYGCLPYDALYEGYFMEAAAAKAYLALYQASHSAPPYSKDLLRLNRDRLADKVRWRHVTGCSGDRHLLSGSCRCSASTGNYTTISVTAPPSCSCRPRHTMVLAAATRS